LSGPKKCASPCLNEGVEVPYIVALPAAFCNRVQPFFAQEGEDVKNTLDIEWSERRNHLLAFIPNHLVFSSLLLLFMVAFIAIRERAGGHDNYTLDQPGMMKRKRSVDVVPSRRSSGVQQDETLMVHASSTGMRVGFYAIISFIRP
jgi:hypothetical protein